MGYPSLEIVDRARKDFVVKRVSVRFEKDRDEKNITVLFRASRQDAQVEQLMNRVREPFVDTIAATDADGGTVLLPFEGITSISSDNKRLKVLADNGTYWLKGSLQEMERLLEPNMFLRISRYEIVNLRKISRFDFTISGTLRIEFGEGMETWASRRYIPQIKNRLKGRVDA
jgi:DNA-binding LytR/AlgR family response regulator